MGLKLKVFPANHGDSFLISFKEDSNFRNILIDGGTGKQSYRQLKEEFKKVKASNQVIDLLIVTHCDDDHIKGIIDIFQDSSVDKTIIKEVWFNSGQLIAKRLEDPIEKTDREIPLTMNNSKKKSINQGITFEKELERLGCWSQTLIMSLLQQEIGNAKITVLSPDLTKLRKLNKAWEVEIDKRKQKSASKTDYSIPIEELLRNPFQEDDRLANGSSIAFILEYKDYQILMLGDSHPSVVEYSLRELGYSEVNKLKVDIVKVSHHGSKYNTSESLLKIIDCKDFIVSTDGKRHGLPNKECFARILSTRQNEGRTTFYFNYSLNNIFLQNDYQKFDFNCEYLSQNGYIYELGE
ncbi:MBL fold metallo-hydrolase [Priestia megaterium]